nr:uncharacterized protein LOC100183597 [Ciona intestinalis]|eukprot:XP_018671384.1 uncharacterized protein LOC100183597 [Ciona intestinalis]
MKQVFVLVVVLVLLNGVSTDDGLESNEFFEIDTSKLDKNGPVRFGAQIYSSTPDMYEPIIKQLGSVFNLAQWSAVWEVSGAYPAPRNASDEEMERWVDSIYRVISDTVPMMKQISDSMFNNSIDVVAYSATAPNTYYMHPNQMVEFRKRLKAEKDGIEVETPTELTKEEYIEKMQNENEFDKFNQLVAEFVPDFAKFWAVSLDQLYKKGLKFPFIELSLEPDSRDYMYIDPIDFAELMKTTVQEIKAKGIPMDRHKIFAPGTSSPIAAKPYVEEIVKDRDTYDAIYSWSIHINDNGQSLKEIERQIQGFRQILQATVPSSWPKKPIVVTSFGMTAEAELVNNGVQFSGDLKTCYSKLYGELNKKPEDLSNAMCQSPIVGVRLLANLFLQYSHTFTQSIYTRLVDHVWSMACDGLVDRFSKPKQILVAFKTFLPYLNEHTYAITKQWTNTEDCFTVGLKSDTRIVIGMANLGHQGCSRSFSLSGLGDKKVTEAFGVTYNNGTVSLTATEPSEALVTKTTLGYDVFPAESDPASDVVEFDVTLVPNASATLVLDLGEADKVTESVQDEQSGRHTEL